MNQALYIKDLRQKTNHSFTIEWQDGQIKEYFLDKLQEACPCANCVDKKEKSHNVKAVSIKSVGRYAIRIQFTSGCSYGIFDYNFLYHRFNG